jgi:transposase
MGKRSDKSFREEAVRLALSSPEPYTKTARDLGIKVGSLYQWINQYRNANSPEMEGEKQLDLVDENRQLKKEILRLKEERDILKKAATFFANELK